MKYRVIRECYGFRNRYWEVGEVVDIDPKENPPHHFQPIGQPKQEPKKDQEETKKGKK